MKINVRNTIFILLNHKFFHDNDVLTVLHFKLEMSIILSLRRDNKSFGVSIPVINGSSINFRISCDNFIRINCRVHRVIYDLIIELLKMTDERNE